MPDDFEGEGGRDTIRIKTNLPWKAVPNETWMTVSPSSGVGSAIVTVTAEKNELPELRAGEIVFGNRLWLDKNSSADELNDMLGSVVVKQSPAITFYLSSEHIAFYSSSSSREISVTSNYSWKVSTDASWLSFSPSSGKGDGTVKVTADENTSPSSRTATITFYVGGTSLSFGTTTINVGGSTYSVSVSQEGTNHEYVDLGLPSRILWATCNLGSDISGGYVDYFAWGETTAKNDYTWSNYKCCNGNEKSLTKYITDSSYGRVDNKKTLDLSDDAANVNWNGIWRMPTYCEWEELCNTDNCTWTWTNQDGHDGYKVTSKTNGNSIFLPATEYSSTEKGLILVGSYWSSSLAESENTSAHCLFFSSSEVSCTTFGFRAYGQIVRPVFSLPFFEVSPEELSFASSGGSSLLSVSSNQSWTVSSDALWLSLSKTLGTGDGTLTISAEANTSSSNRSCKVMFRAGEIIYTVDVFQEGSPKTIVGHSCVDLGLPSGILWATCNLGASSPEEYGDYYAWGETAPKSEYNWITYKWSYDGNDKKMKKYCTEGGYGIVDNITVLELTDDAAYINWGDGWRIPTREEWEELANYCTWKSIDKNGVAGKEGIGPSGEAIFFPAAGHKYGDSCYGTDGYYWSSSLLKVRPNAATLFFLKYQGSDESFRSGDRSYGHTIRAVCRL